ncbi:DNA primase [Sinobacterium caligoides]|uniref:DNA primase n=1 Tax=Sinobacterium caligoides TaxID=933926 RepID=A0A3N2DQU4_9GAMM|nr:DNA primase [Sinobacterium caligoides]ROS01675.1 DNA primase [Sinobacterium caligoides]
MAGRIPQGFIDDLLERVDIVEVIDARTVLKKAGRNYKGLCPFHDEKTPSFSVNADKQFYYCFGCGAGGNAVSFMMDYERLDFPQAVEALAASISMQVPREEDTAVSIAASANKALYALLEKCAEWFHQNLRLEAGGQPAVDYLKGRGLDGQTASNFQIGYAPPGWDNLLKKFGDTPDQVKLLIEGGMLIEKDGGGCYDRFRERIMFPIRDHRGRVVAFGGRVLGDDKPKYLNSPETSVFSKSRELYGYFEARKSKQAVERIVVVEGYMDVVALAQAGIPYGTATLGTATSSSHLERIFRLCPEVVFCFDGDKAGRAAANRALESVLPLMRDGLQARFLFLPDGEDPDTLVRQVGADRFEHQIESAQPLSEYLFEHAADGLDISSMDGRARLSTLALPMIDSIPAGVFQSLLHKELATRTGLEAETLEQIRLQAKQSQQQEQQRKQQQDRRAEQRYQQQRDGSTATSQPKQGADNTSTAAIEGADEAIGYLNAEQANDYNNYQLPDGDPYADAHNSYRDDDYTGRSYNNSSGGYRRKDGDKPWKKDRGPKQRAPRSELPQPRCKIQQAITLLLFYPINIDAIHSAEVLDQHPGPDSLLLKEMVEFLKKQPDTPTYTLLGNWIGTEHYGRLQQLLKDDQLITDQLGAREELADIFAFLDKRQSRSQLEEELNQLAAIPFNEMSREQKQRYGELLLTHSKH